MDLRLLFVEQAHKVVILFDGFDGLDENCLAAGAGAVHDAGHTALLFDFYRDHETLSADRDQFVLHGAAFG